MRILFITATRIGDAVLSTGLLDHLLRTYPDARFTIACGPVAEGVFARMPRRDATIIVEKRRFDLHWAELWARTAGRVWDLAIDLRGSALTFLLPARRRAIMRGGRRKGHRLGHLASVLGLDPAPLPVAWTDPADRARAAALLPDGAPVIGLGPTANWDGKIWPPERFVALFRALATGPLEGARPAVFAGPGEAERARAAPVLAALPEAIDLAGRLSLPEAAACLARCALFAGNDSGLMHLAAAAGAPTLGLFGPSDSREYAPSGPCVAFVEAPGPQGTAPIAGLTVEAALAAARGLLEAGRAGVPEVA
jgi:heptosyltransferase III